MSNPNDTLLVLAAAYDSVAQAEADYEGVKELYREIAASHDFDAAVLERDAEGKVHVVRKHEQPTRHGAAKGLGWGLAVGAAFALFPAVGLAGALAGAGGAGAAIGAVKGHVEGGLGDDELRRLGETLEAGQAGLLVVYATNMADQVAAIIRAENRYVSREIDARADELARQVTAAQSG
ncbi:MAG TPA: DUF1269 domain-containing protein [Jiangellales bacterium]|nr:DUF1269 domain-containing protein [Jiangellales bacterium]